MWKICKRKTFEFSIDVLKKVNKSKKITLKVVGYGPLKNKIIHKLEKSKINYIYRGPVQPKNILKEFQNLKFFYSQPFMICGVLLQTRLAYLRQL